MPSVLRGSLDCSETSKPGFQRKKRSTGMRTATISRFHEESANAGITVMVGMGQYGVGIPDDSSPSQPKNNSEIPDRITSPRLFIVNSCTPLSGALPTSMP